MSGNRLATREAQFLRRLDYSAQLDPFPQTLSHSHRRCKEWSRIVSVVLAVLDEVVGFRQRVSGASVQPRAEGAGPVGNLAAVIVPSADRPRLSLAARFVPLKVTHSWLSIRVLQVTQFADFGPSCRRTRAPIRHEQHQVVPMR